jgi:glutaredoxin
MVKKFLQDKNISFEDADVTTDTLARQEMIDKSGQMGVPVIVIDDQVVVGFDQAKLQSLLGIN